jgi:molybdopterin-guanine dinucleotide biosynthesis protein A
MTVAAVECAREVVAVGPPVYGYVPHRPLFWTREAPPFGGPVAALAAGARCLERPGSRVLAVAVDMPRVAEATSSLLVAAAGDGFDVMVGADGGRRQPLVSLFGPGVLQRATAEGDHRDRSMNDLLRVLRVREVALPAGSAADVDDWAAARLLGVTDEKEGRP